MEQQMDEKDLKVQALTEQLGTQSSRYEGQIADLRVANTIYSKQLESAKTELETLRSEVFRLQGEIEEFNNEAFHNLVDDDYEDSEVLEGELLDG